MSVPKLQYRLFNVQRKHTPYRLFKYLEGFQQFRLLLVNVYWLRYLVHVVGSENFIIFNSFLKYPHRNFHLEQKKLTVLFYRYESKENVQNVNINIICRNSFVVVKKSVPIVTPSYKLQTILNTITFSAFSTLFFIFRIPKILALHSI